MTDLVLEGPQFLSPKDEDAFFTWFNSIPVVKEIRGEGTKLHIQLATAEVDDESLRELLAIFSRHKIDMSLLRKFENNLNRKWFRDNKSAYWYRPVFEHKRVDVRAVAMDR